jgi:hypothetical protein
MVRLLLFIFQETLVLALFMMVFPWHWKFEIRYKLTLGTWYLFGHLNATKNKHEKNV